MILNEIRKKRATHTKNSTQQLRIFKNIDQITKNSPTTLPHPVIKNDAYQIARKTANQITLQPRAV